MYVMALYLHVYVESMFLCYSSLTQLKAAGLFKYVWPFCYHQALKG